MEKLSSITLQAANKTKFTTFEQKTLTLDLGFTRRFSWVFTVAALDLTILGVNVLERYELLVDTRKRFLTMKGSLSSTEGEELHHFLKFHTNATSEKCEITGYTPETSKPNPQHSEIEPKVTYKNKAEGSPAFARPSGPAPDKHKITRAEFDYILHLGIIPSSDS